MTPSIFCTKGGEGAKCWYKWLFGKVGVRLPELGDFLIKIGGFLIKIGWISHQNWVIFSSKLGDFLIKIGHLFTKLGDLSSSSDFFLPNWVTFSSTLVILSSNLESRGNLTNGDSSAPLTSIRATPASEHCGHPVCYHGEVPEWREGVFLSHPVLLCACTHDGLDMGGREASSFAYSHGNAGVCCFLRRRF